MTYEDQLDARRVRLEAAARARLPNVLEEIERRGV